MHTEIPSGALAPESEGRSTGTAMTVVTSLFFIWGFATSLNDILIPHLQGVFSLTNFQSMMVQLAFFSAYFLFALPWGKVVDRIGYRNTMVTGLMVSSLGCLLFLPAAVVVSYGIFLSALIVLAAGITALQVAANPYVTALGSPRTAPSRLNLAQAFNSLGTVVGPPLGGWLIFRGVEGDTGQHLSGVALRAFQQAQASSVKVPYFSLALVLLALGALIRFALPAPTMHTSNIRTPLIEHEGSVLKRPRVLLATIGIFLYVGGEVSIGSFLVKYLHMPTIAGVSMVMASNLTGLCYWGGAMAGRFIGSGLLQRVRASALLSVCAAIAGALVITSMVSHGLIAAAALLAVGLFNSIMFPSIFAIGVEGLGSRTSEASSVMVMAIVGGAVIPLIEGKLADAVGIQHALLIPVLCYVYILLFGLWGTRRGESVVTDPAL